MFSDKEWVQLLGKLETLDGQELIEKEVILYLGIAIEQENPNFLVALLD